LVVSRNHINVLFANQQVVGNRVYLQSFQQNLHVV